MNEFPTHDLKYGDIVLQYASGNPMPFGASMTESGGVNFSVNSRDATSCTLVLYHHGDAEPFCEIPSPRSSRSAATTL